MEEIINALSKTIHDTFIGLRCLTPAMKICRMRNNKAKRMQYTRDLFRVLLSIAIVLKSDSKCNPQEVRSRFAEFGRIFALFIYDLDIERQKQIVNEEVERCKTKPSCR